MGRVATLGGAAALGTFAYAAYTGYEESDKLNKALALSGDLVGRNTGQINAMAGSLATAANTSIGQAREALHALAASGVYVGETLPVAGRAVLSLQKLSGQSSADIIKDFAGMREGVAQWAASHYKSYNYLTVEQYKYIRSLEAQGLVQDAMRENLRILDDAMRSRTLPALGLLETAWKGVGEAASWSWDKMLGLGRAETLEEKLAKAITAATAPARNGVNPLQADARRAAAQQLVEDLRQEIYQRDEANSVNSAATVKNQKAIED